MKGRSLGFFLILVSVGLWFLAGQYPGAAEDQYVTTARVIYTFAGVIFTLGLGLLLFNKIVLGPWLTLNFGESISLTVGPPGFRFNASGVPQKNSIQIPGTQIFLFMSFMARLTIKVSLSWIPYSYIQAEHGYRWGIGAGLLCLAILFSIEAAFLKTLAPDEAALQPDKVADKDAA